MTTFTAEQIKYLETKIAFLDAGDVKKGFSVEGDVKGNILGSVKGNVAGDVKGNILGDPRVKALQAKAQAVIDRWDSPLWKDLPHTGESIADLRAALSALDKNK